MIQCNNSIKLSAKKTETVHRFLPNIVVVAWTHLDNLYYHLLLN